MSYRPLARLSSHPAQLPPHSRHTFQLLRSGCPSNPEAAASNRAAHTPRIEFPAKLHSQYKYSAPRTMHRSSLDCLQPQSSHKKVFFPARDGSAPQNSEYSAIKLPNSRTASSFQLFWATILHVLYMCSRTSSADPHLHLQGGLGAGNN